MSGEAVKTALDGGRRATSVDAAEVAKFGRMAADWWDPKGKFAPLHALNPVRLGFIRDEVVKAFSVTPAAGDEPAPPFSGGARRPQSRVLRVIPSQASGCSTSAAAAG